MSDTAQDSEERRSRFPTIREVDAVAPFRWLGRGAADLRERPVPALFYGICFALMGWVTVAVFDTQPGLLLALVCGFLLVGPFFSMGLYEIARRRERGEPCNLPATTVAWSRNLKNIGIFAVGLAIVMLLWARASLMTFALFYTHEMPSIEGFMSQLLSLDNIEFLLVYLMVGSTFALIAFAASVVSIPLMLDRNMDAITAMLASVATFGRNLPVMVLWALIVVVLTVIGFATLFVGLIFTVPLVGLATWHGYREMLEPVAQQASGQAGAPVADGRS